MKLLMRIFPLLLLFSTQVLADERIRLEVQVSGPSFSMSLPANPTTGYQWVIKQYDKRYFKLVSSHYTPKKSLKMGSGGVMWFKFKLRALKSYPKKTQMKFNYQRSWDPSSARAKEVEIVFQPVKKYNSK